MVKIGYGGTWKGGKRIDEVSDSEEGSYTTVSVGPSRSLAELNKKLQSNDLYVMPK